MLGKRFEKCSVRDLKNAEPETKTKQQVHTPLCKKTIHLLMSDFITR